MGTSEGRGDGFVEGDDESGASERNGPLKEGPPTPAPFSILSVTFVVTLTPDNTSKDAVVSLLLLLGDSIPVEAAATIVAAPAATPTATSTWEVVEELATAVATIPIGAAAPAPAPAAEVTPVAELVAADCDAWTAICWSAVGGVGAAATFSPPVVTTPLASAPSAPSPLLQRPMQHSMILGSCSPK